MDICQEIVLSLPPEGVVEEGVPCPVTIVMKTDIFQEIARSRPVEGEVEVEVEAVLAIGAMKKGTCQ